MHMGMVVQIPSPGLQHSQNAQLGARVLVVAAHLQQGRSTVPDQQCVEDALVGADQSAQLFGHGEGDQPVGQWQKTAALAIEPLGGVGVTALGTGTVIAGMVNKLASTAVASEELAAQRSATAGEHGLDRTPM